MVRNTIPNCAEFKLFSTRGDEVFERASIIPISSLLAITDGNACVDQTLLCDAIAAAPSRTILFEPDAVEFQMQDLTDVHCENDANRITIMHWNQLFGKSRVCPDPDRDLLIGNIAPENPISDPTGLGLLAAQWLTGDAGCAWAGFDVFTCRSSWDEIELNGNDSSPYTNPDVSIFSAPHFPSWDITNWDDPIGGILVKAKKAFMEFPIVTVIDTLTIVVTGDARDLFRNTSPCNTNGTQCWTVTIFDATGAEHGTTSVRNAVFAAGQTTLTFKTAVAGMLPGFSIGQGYYNAVVDVTQDPDTGQLHLEFYPSSRALRKGDTTGLSGIDYHWTVGGSTAGSFRMTDEQRAYINLTLLNRCYMEMGRFGADLVAPLLSPTILADAYQAKMLNIFQMQVCSMACEQALLPTIDMAGLTDAQAIEMFDLVHSFNRTHGAILHNATQLQEQTLSAYITTNGYQWKCNDAIPLEYYPQTIP